MKTYSSLVKEYLLTTNDLHIYENDCCLETIILALLSFKEYRIADNDKIELRAEKGLISNFITKSLKKSNILFTKEKSTNSKGKIIHIFLIDNSILLKNLNNMDELPKNDCCKLHWIKIAFLFKGYINNPDNSYYLEFRFNNLSDVKKIEDILHSREINISHYKKNNSDNYVLYINRIDDIVNTLALIGAYKILLDIENLRIEKEIKNFVVRQVNYETSNLKKTVESSVKYIDAIKWYMNEGFFENLPKTLKETAILRINNPNSSLNELSELCEKPLTKSAINHRLRRLYGIIQNEKNKERIEKNKEQKIK